MELKIKKKTGKIVKYSSGKVKDMLKTVGFSGGLLVKATGEVFKEAKKLTKQGVITVVDLEKAVVKGVSNTNKVAINTTKKVTRRILG